MTTSQPARTGDIFQVLPLTERGRLLVGLAEEHADDFRARADQHDRENSFPAENIAALQKSGVMTACIPEQFGGLEVGSSHDFALAISRLARGDGATAIA